MNPRYLQDGFEKRLAHLIEECGEVIQAAGKIQRWGPMSVNPDIPIEKQETNLHWLLRELTDLSTTISRLHSAVASEYGFSEYEKNK